MTADATARFEALFRATYPAVRRYAFHRAITGSDADDLVSETFMVAWRRLDVVPADEPLPWLLAVAANVQRNRARSARRYQALIDRLPAPRPAPPPSGPNDDAAAVARALAAMSDDDREILILVGVGRPHPPASGDRARHDGWRGAPAPAPGPQAPGGATALGHRETPAIDRTVPRRPKGAAA